MRKRTLMDLSLRIQKKNLTRKGHTKKVNSSNKKSRSKTKKAVSRDKQRNSTLNKLTNHYSNNVNSTKYLNSQSLQSTT